MNFTTNVEGREYTLVPTHNVTEYYDFILAPFEIKKLMILAVSYRVDGILREEDGTEFEIVEIKIQCKCHVQALLVRRSMSSSVYTLDNIPNVH